MKRIACIVVALATVASIACSESKTESAACSNGPVYDRSNSTFAYEADGTENNTCTPHCGYSDAPNGLGGGRYYADALPSGACDGIGAPCNMTIAMSCCGSNSPNGPVHRMRCDCVGSTWKCVIVTMGAGSCSTCSDAGRDGSSP